jgi:cytochrome c peroxidase
MKKRKKILCLSVASVILTSCGGSGSSSTTTTTTPVTQVNSAPTVSSANTTQTASKGFEFSYDATQGGSTFNDADGDALTYSCSFAPAANGLTDANGVLSGTLFDIGDITVTITATDPDGASVSNNFTISVGVDQTAIQTVFQGAIDLESLEDYAGQIVPNYITKLNEGGNPISDEGATLGRVLFYDAALSTTGTFSCASCHLQSTGFSDPSIVSTGVEGGQTGRHSMRLINTQFADEERFFWDERAASHEDQESQPIQDHNELGFSGTNGRPTLDDLITTLEGLEHYEELFRFVYLDPDITETRIQQALAQFTKSIWSFDSRFDEGRAQVNNNGVNFPNYTADENAGKSLYLQAPNDGGAGCQACHQAPEFDIRQGSDQNGVVGVAGSTNVFDVTNTRSPSLRDLMDPNGNSNGPFMHDGSLATLREVIDHYDAIQVPTDEPIRTEFLNTIDNRLLPGGNPQRLNLSETEKNQLEAFLLTLSGNEIYTDPKLSDPFP